MDAAAASVLLDPLRPWLDLITNGESSCEFKNPSRTEEGVVFSFRVVLDHSEENQDEREVTRLREAIDLAFRALSVHTAHSLFLWEENESGLGSPMRYASDEPINRHLLRDVPFEIKLHIGVRGVTDASLLKRQIADEFFVSLSQTISTDASYLAARARLDAILTE